jgi:hypothetical protein
MNRIGLLWLLLVFYTFCLRERVKVDYPAEPSVPVLNAFFTPDSLWKARLVYSKMKTDTSYRPIKDAQLPLSGMTAQRLFSITQRRVLYRLIYFLGRRPIYHPSVVADGTDLSGTSFAPEEPNLSVVSFNPAWSTYLFDADLMDYSVMRFMSIFRTNLQLPIYNSGFGMLSQNGGTILTAIFYRPIRWLFWNKKEFLLLLSMPCCH